MNTQDKNQYTLPLKYCHRGKNSNFSIVCHITCNKMIGNEKDRIRLLSGNLF